MQIHAQLIRRLGMRLVHAALPDFANAISLWATALRQERNIGAHAGDADVSKENAQDVLDFTVAIFEYVYTLSEKYADFMARKAARKGGP
jgi:hypothetical protein